jgi:hypothetical protein
MKKDYQDLDAKLKEIPVNRISENNKKEMHQNLMDQVILHENLTMKQRLKRRFFLSLASLLVVCLMLFILYVSMNGGLNVLGQSDYEDVIQHYDRVENLEDFEQFMEDIADRKTSSLNVIHYGIEGQELITHLSYNNKEIGVSYTLSGEVYETDSCKSISSKSDNDYTKYYLQKCNRNGGGIDIDLLSIPHIEHNAFSKAEIVGKSETGGERFIDIILKTPPSFLVETGGGKFSILIDNQQMWSEIEVGKFYHIRYGLHKDGFLKLREKSLATVQEW